MVDFPQGSIVRLNSGGPKMTVISEAKAGSLTCQWFDRNGKMHKAPFDMSALSEFKPASISATTTPTPATPESE